MTRSTVLRSNPPWALAVSLAATLASGCLTEPDVDTAAQALACPRCIDGTCDPLSGCCVGLEEAPACPAFLTNPDVTLAATYTPHTQVAVTSGATYGASSCPGRFYVEYDSPGGIWWDRITAALAPGSVPKTRCDCENTEISLEVADSLCAGSCANQGTCAETGAGCCDASDCGPSDACIGATPPVCSGVGVVRTATIRGRWAMNLLTGTYGCRHTVTIARDAYGFEGKYPEARAVALDKRTGATKPVVVTAYND